VRLPEVAEASDLPEDRPLLVFARTSLLEAPPNGVTIFDLSRRQYTRTRSEAEIRTLSYLKSYRARFVPADHPRVMLPKAYQDRSGPAARDGLDENGTRP